MTDTLKKVEKEYEKESKKEKEDEKIIDDLEKVWPKNKRRGSNLYLYLGKKNSENHGHVFHNEKKHNWYYNIKCNNNKGNDRIRHKINKTKRVPKLKTEIKDNWRTECPAFIKSKKLTKNKTRKNKKN